jgi:hypothetical protein
MCWQEVKRASVEQEAVPRERLRVQGRAAQGASLLPKLPAEDLAIQEASAEVNPSQRVPIQIDHIDGTIASSKSVVW